jgi:predicted RNase H-like nuclease
LSGPRDWVVGVDGCRGGWIAVFRELNGRAIEVEIHEKLEDVLDSPRAPRIVAVDVPIGLPDVAEPGGRSADREARARLGSRKSSVFSCPSRAALDASRAGGDFAAVCAASRAASPLRVGLSRQSCAILPKIIEVDDLIDPAQQNRVIEVHPELCFATAAGVPMKHSKKRRAGRLEREVVLANVGFPIASLDAPSRRGAARDDLLDAAIACWTAERRARGHASVVPSNPPRDSRGLRMEIWA